MPNIVVVSGFIDSDVNVKQVGTPTKKVAEFRVNDGSTWISIKAWQEVADRVPPRGTQVIVHGRLATRSYENKEGVKVFVTEVVASMVDQVAGPAAADEDIFG